MASTTTAADSRVTELSAPASVGGVGSWVERLIDRLNPIFVKETRQAIKSRQFLGAFLVLLLLSWLISLLVISSAGQGLDFGTWGRDLFASYYVVLAGAILVVVPFSAFRSLMSEREEATFEPLIISAISPRQIVLGKLLSAMLQAFLFYSAIAPFMAFTALLQGFDIVHVTLLLSLGLGVSVWVSIGALAVSAMTRGRMWQTIVSLAVLAGMLIVFAFAWGMAFQSWWLRWNDPWMLWGLAAWIIAGASNIVLLQEVAVANLTFHADNRSTGLRVICQVKFLILWLGVYLSAQYLGSSFSSAAEDLIVFGLVFGMMLWSAAGLFFVTESDDLSHRIIRRLPRRGWMRLAIAPWYPGGARGLVLVMGNLLFLAAALWLLVDRFGKSPSDDEIAISRAILLYTTIYLGTAAAFSRWAMRWSHAVQPAHCRVATIVLIALSMAAPLFVLILSPYRRYSDYSLLLISNPMMTFDHLEHQGAQSDAIFAVLTFGALLAVVVNAPAMIRGMHEVAAATSQPPQSTDE